MSIAMEQVRIDLLDEGRFKKEADDLLQQIARAMLVFVEKNGQKAKGAKAKLSLDISIKATDTESRAFEIETKPKITLPSVTKATWSIADTDPETSEVGLFVRSCGSGKDNPRQAVLCTEDGRDVRDGKIVEEVTDKPTGKSKK